MEVNIALAHGILANYHALNTADDHLFTRFIRNVQQCGMDYQPPKRYEIGRKLLDATFECYFQEQMKLLMQDADIYGNTTYGDGSSINITAKLNIMASSPWNLTCVLDVIDCTGLISKGGKKNTK
jgi:hypothetical protein